VVQGFPAVVDRHGPFLGRLPKSKKRQLQRASSSFGNPPRVLMILRSDRLSDSTLLVV